MGGASGFYPLTWENKMPDVHPGVFEIVSCTRDPIIKEVVVDINIKEFPFTLDDCEDIDIANHYRKKVLEKANIEHRRCPRCGDDAFRVNFLGY